MTSLIGELTDEQVQERLLQIKELEKKQQDLEIAMKEYEVRFNAAKRVRDDCVVRLHNVRTAVKYSEHLKNERLSVLSRSAAAAAAAAVQKDQKKEPESVKTKKVASLKNLYPERFRVPSSQAAPPPPPPFCQPEPEPAPSLSLSLSLSDDDDDAAPYSPEFPMAKEEISEATQSQYPLSLPPLEKF
jgi:hypothetical protein